VAKADITNKTDARESEGPFNPDRYPENYRQLIAYGVRIMAGKIEFHPSTAANITCQRKRRAGRKPIARNVPFDL